VSEEVKPRIKVGRSYPPDRLGLRVTNPDNGHVLRLAEDEHNANNILSNLRFSTEIPGGYKELSNVLNRMPQRVWPELSVNSDVVAYLASGKHVFEGYIDKAPNVSGPQASITPSILGYQSMMEDTEGIKIGWSCKDHSRWNEPPAARKLNLGTPFKPVGPENEPSSSQLNGTSPVLRLKNENGWGTVRPICEAWFDGNGIPIGAINGKFQEAGNTSGNLNFLLITFMSDNGASAASGTVSGDFFTASIGEFWNGPAVPGHRFAVIEWYYSAENAGAEGYSFDCLAYGPIWVRSERACNLPAYNYGGANPFLTWGFKAKDMLVDLFAAKATNGLEARAEDIDDDSFIIQEAWYDDGSQTLADIVKELIKYGWYDWGFYNKKRFFYKAPGTYGETWKTTVAACNLNEVGEESTRSYNKCKVEWTDASGEPRSVGPIGSGATFESTRCETLNVPSRPRQKLITISGAMTETTAFEIAERFLIEAAMGNVSGSATLSGYVMNSQGYFYPVSVVKAGDYLEVTDAHDRTPRKIVSTDYTHQNRQNQLELGAPPSGLNALLERLQEQAAAAGV
jgi:hypothetical protein